MADKIDKAVKKKWITETRLIREAKTDPNSQNEFLTNYFQFLKAIIASRGIWAGRKKINIVLPQGNFAEIIDELTPTIFNVCCDFLEKKLTPEFIEDIRRTHRKEAAHHHHVSVRTTLQTMLVNQIKKDAGDNLIVKTSGSVIELYLKECCGAATWQIENQTGTISDFCSGTKYGDEKQEVREFLRRFRIMLTRMAGKGNVSIYPTPYECYCLYHNCFGKDRREVLRAYVTDPEEQEKFLLKEEWNDETVGALLAGRYQGATQTNSKRKISCERKTINNRRREYQNHLLKCILDYMPDAEPEEAKAMLDQRDADADAVIDFCTVFICHSGLTRSETMERMKTRTLEISK